MKWIRRALVVAIVGGIVLAVAWSFVPRPVRVDVAPVTRGPFEATVDADGVTRVRDRYLVSAPVTGTLARIELAPGDQVAAGAAVARISAVEPPLSDARTRAQAAARVEATRASQRQAQALVARAAAARDLAERDRARAAELLRQGVAVAAAADAADVEARTRGRDLESARFAAAVATHEVAIAEAAVGRLARRAVVGEELVLQAPVAGRVLRVLRESEGMVAAGTPLLELADPAALEVVVDVPTADAVSVRTGAAVTLERWGGERSLSGRVRLVEPAAFTKVSALGVEEQRVNVIIDLTDPAESFAPLGDGYRIEARISVWRGDSVVQVPSSALFRDGAAWAVFMWRDGRAALRRVDVGRRSGVRTQVARGVDDGEEVIIHPGDAVADGVRVARR